MKKTLFVTFLSLSVTLAFGQSNGDYRTRGDGYWSSVSVWEVFNNGWQLLSSPAAGPFRNIVPSNTSGVITVLHNVTVILNLTIDQTVVENNARLNIASGKVLRIAENPQTSLRLEAGSILANSGTLDLQSLLTTTACEVFGRLVSVSTILTSNASLLRFNAGSIYQHANKNGSVIPLATWDTNSLLYMTGPTGVAPVPTNMNQAFGNVLWNTTGMTATTYSLEGQLTNVTGDLRFLSTGSANLRLNLNGPGSTLNIGGDLTIDGGIITLAQNQTTTTNVVVGGNFTQNAGTFNLGNANNQAINLNVAGDFEKTGGTFNRGTGTGVGALRFNGAAQKFASSGSMTGSIRYFVEPGSNLDLGTSALTGTGTFRVEAGATIQVKSQDPNGAIQAGAVGGNIQVTGARTYVAGSTVIYSGAGTQFMSSAHPTTSNTIIANGDAVYLRTNATINGTLTLQSGSLVIGANTLTLGGTVSYPAGFIGITTASNLIINGTGNFGSLVLAPVEFAQNPMNNLTINRAGTVTLGLELIVAGTFRQTAGTFVIDGNSGSTFTLRGPVVQTGGNIGTTIDPMLVIDGAGALPANLSFAPGASLEFLNMNRVGATFSTSSPLTVTNTLSLLNGTINHPSSNITMGNNSLVLRTAGSINQLLGAEAMYNVVYQPTTPITTGNELPVATDRLQNLIKQGSATVTLDRDLVVNGEMFLDAGVFDAGTGNDLTLRDNLIINGGSFEPQQGLVTFAANFPQAIMGTGPISFYNLTIAQPVATSLTLSTTADIENRLSVTSASTFNAGNQLLTLLSNASSTAFVSQLAGGAAIEGTVIAQRYLPNAAQVETWRYITPVVTNSFVSDWKTELMITGTFSDPATGPGIEFPNSPSMYIWNEAAPSVGVNTRYRAYPTSGSSTLAPLQNGRGYSVYVRTQGDHLFDSRGRLAQGPRPVAVTNIGPGADTGWNLIGNPYPSPIDWDLVAVALPGAVDNAVYITDNADNANDGTLPTDPNTASYIDGVSVPASFQGIITPGQAFFVHTTANATITFQEAHKFAGQGQFFREAPPTDVLRISIETANSSDEIAIRMRDGATDLFDQKFDARKFPGGDIALSSISADNQKLSINAINSMACGKTIPLTVETAIVGSYTLNFSGIESFVNNTPLYLKDETTDELIDLTKSDKYSFTVADGATLKDRFSIVVGGQVVDTNLDVAGATVCESETTARVSLRTSQKDVMYSVVWNGQAISSEVVGTGSKIELPVTVASLPQGVQEVNVLAHHASCGPETLTNTAVLKIVKTEKVESVEHGSICEPGTLTLKAHGANGLKFNWYEGLSDVRPVFTSAGEFITPSLTKSKTYFVAALNELGCEGERVPVEANIIYVDPVVIEQQGSMLISSYDEGNKWFLDGVEIENGTGKEIEALASGNYTVQVTCKGCKTTATTEIHIIGEENSGVSVVVFPNPTPGKVNVEVKSKNGEPLVRVINSQGQELANVRLKGESEKYFGEFDLMSYPNGVYMIQVRDGQKQFIKKISKIE